MKDGSVGGSVSFHSLQGLHTAFRISVGHFAFLLRTFSTLDISGGSWSLSLYSGVSATLGGPLNIEALHVDGEGGE